MSYTVNGFHTLMTSQRPHNATFFEAYKFDDLNYFDRYYEKYWDYVTTKTFRERRANLTGGM